MSGTGFSVCGSRRAKYGYRLTEATCSVCGKAFMRSDEHGWNAGGKSKYQCSYHCYRVIEEEERRKFRERMDKRIAAYKYVEEHKDDARKKRVATAKQTEKSKKLAGALEATMREAETCEAWVQIFSARAKRYEKGTKEHKQAKASVDKWRKKLEAAQQAVYRLNTEMEANENVQSTPEEKVVG